MEKVLVQRFTKFFLLLILLSCNSDLRIYKLYYNNGDVKLSGAYLKNKAHGYWEGFYPNGQLKSAGEYYKGELVGYWAWYYEDGSLIKDSIYTYPKSYE